MEHSYIFVVLFVCLQSEKVRWYSSYSVVGVPDTDALCPLASTRIRVPGRQLRIHFFVSNRSPFISGFLSADAIKTLWLSYALASCVVASSS